MATTNNQPQDFQRLRRPSWNPPSSTPSIPLGSRLGAYAATPKTVGKNDYFDLSYSEKLDIRLAFVLFDSRKFGKLNYKDLKVKFAAVPCGVLLLFTWTGAEVCSVRHANMKDHFQGLR